MSGCRFALEAAADEDLPALLRVERRSFSQPWSAESFRAEMQDPTRGRVVVLREPFAPGDAERGVLAYCVFQMVLDELHILDLAVRPERRRESLGRRLLARVLDLGCRRGARLALLEVRRSNSAALELYRSFEFSHVGTRCNYYTNPREDALVLRLDPLDASWRAPESQP